MRIINMLGTNSYPYIFALALITILASPYISCGPTRFDYRTCCRTHGALPIILLAISYIFFVLFAVGKSIKPIYGTADINAYEQYYLESSGDYLSYITHKTTFEFGYSTLAYVFRCLTSNFKVFLVFLYSITFFCVVHFLKATSTGKLALIRNLCVFSLLVNQLVTLRHSVAVAISLNAMPAMSKKKYGLSAMIILLAVSIHFSSVVMLAVLILAERCGKRNEWRIEKAAPYIMAYVCLSIALLPEVLGRINFGSKQVYIGNTGSFGGVYLASLICLVFSVHNRRLIVRANKMNELLAMSLCCIYLALPIQVFASIGYRFTSFFQPILVVLLDANASAPNKSTRLKGLPYIQAGYFTVESACCFICLFVYCAVLFLHMFSADNTFGLYHNDVVSALLNSLP